MAGQPDDSTDPWLTIVTVVKDDPEGLRATAQSLAAQRLQGIEWILVDGSDTTSQDVWPASLTPLLRCFREPPRGIYQAMNVGLREARAPHILFLNAGDVLVDAGVLDELRPACGQESGGWLYGRTELIEPSGRRRLSPSFDFEQEKRRRFRRGRFPQQPSAIFSAAALRGIGGFDEGLSIAADYKAIVQLSLQQGPVFIERTITRFRLDGTSAVNWQPSLREAYQARCDVFGLRGSQRLQEWWLSRGVWLRSWLFRTIPRRSQ